MNKIAALPRITVVTPSFNQGEFIEQTIKSVLNQNYPNLEYFIYDGGSTDGTIEILKKYDNKINYWVSEKDNGQADAILKGFEKSTGEIICWINSDDIFLQNALLKVGKYFSENPEMVCLVGSTIIIDEESNIIKHFNLIPTFSIGSKISFKKLMLYGVNFNQPSTFFNRKAFFDVGGFDKTMKFAFDLDLYFKFCKKQKLSKTIEFLSAFRIHTKSKTTVMQDICKKETNALLSANGINNYHKINKILSRWFYLIQNYLYKYFILIFKLKSVYKKVKQIKILK